MPIANAREIHCNKVHDIQKAVASNAGQIEIFHWLTAAMLKETVSPFITVLYEELADSTDLSVIY